MPEEQKPTVEVPEVKPDTVPTEPVVAAETADATKPADETKPLETTDATDAANAELNNPDIKPVDEGHLAHKAQGASFPK